MKTNTHTDLERMVEPLASYICASGQPRAALAAAFAALFREVEQTNRAASAHVSTRSQNRVCELHV
jgi:hypothetical protein